MKAGAFHFKHQTAHIRKLRYRAAHSHELQVNAKNRVIKLWLHKFKRESVIQ